MQNELIINCPHCDQLIIILELNCRIFRCGIYKKNFEQINPHLNKIICDELAANNLIYGCGKPFKIDENNKVLRVLVGDNNDPAGDEGYQWLIDNLGGTWIKTSYNASIRKNFAGIGYIYDKLSKYAELLMV